MMTRIDMEQPSGHGYLGPANIQRTAQDDPQRAAFVDLTARAIRARETARYGTDVPIQKRANGATFGHQRAVEAGQNGGGDGR